MIPSKMDMLFWNDLSNLVSAMHKISMFSSTTLSKSHKSFLLEFIFRYKKNNAIEWECRKRFKAALIFSL